MAEECSSSGKTRLWAEIDLCKIAHNLGQIKKMVKPHVRIMAVVKANAYGHGAVPVAAVLLDGGADRLAVATLDEGIELRTSGISAPIQILGYTHPSRICEVLNYGIIQTVYVTDLAKAISNEAIKRNAKAIIHIKLNTGMNRLGFPAGNAIDDVLRIADMPGLVIEGIMTHFSSADDTKDGLTYDQFERFMKVCARLDDRGVHIPIRHVCNSAATLRFPEMHLDMVRPGIALYGYSLNRVLCDQYGLLPALALKAKVSHVNCIKKGEGVGYGTTYRTGQGRVIAVIPAGYADGYSRRLSNNGRVLLHGAYAPITGSVCMDYTMVDVTGISGTVRPGDEAVLLGRQHENEIAVEELAHHIGTIDYEVLCMIGARVPREYLGCPQSIS